MITVVVTIMVAIVSLVVAPLPITLLLVLIQFAVVAILIVVIGSIPLMVVSIFVRAPAMVVLVIWIVGAIVAGVLGATNAGQRHSKRRQQQHRTQVFWRGHDLLFLPVRVPHVLGRHLRAIGLPRASGE